MLANQPRYTFAHPYILADNRHYTFYIWSKILGRSGEVRMALAMPYVYSIYSLIRSLSGGQHQVCGEFDSCQASLPCLKHSHN